MAGIASTEPRYPSVSALRPRMVSTLLWLRWKLFLRGFQRGNVVVRIIGSIVLLLLISSFGIPMFIGMIAGFHYFLPNQLFQATNILMYILGGIYVLWLILPLLQFSINEGLDVSKLSIYPVTRPEIMAGLLLSTFLDIPTLFILLLFAGIGIGWAISPLQIALIVITLALMYIHIVSLSQLFLSSLLGLLKSRQWRDATIIVASLIGFSISILSQIFTRFGHADPGAAGTAITNFINFDIGAYLQFLPPGMAGRAITAIYSGSYGVAALWIGTLAITALIIIWGWSAVLVKALSSSEEGGSTRRAQADTSKKVQHEIAISSTRLSQGWIPEPILAIFQKDMIYFWRDPQYKRVLISGIYFIALQILSTLQHQFGASNVFLYLAVFSLVLSFSMSAFGYEGDAISTLALFPIRPWQLLAGKNLAVFVLGSTEAVILIGVQAVVGKSFSLAGYSLIQTISLILIALGIGNISAIFFPTRVVAGGIGRQQSDAGSSFTNVIARLGAFLCAIVLSLPFTAGTFVLTLIGASQYIPVVIIGGLIYAGLIYGGITVLAASQYYSRIDKIIAAITRE